MAEGHDQRSLGILLENPQEPERIHPRLAEGHIDRCEPVPDVDDDTVIPIEDESHERSAFHLFAENGSLT